MATGEGISTLLPPTQTCSNCCRYCCKLFVLVRFGIISSLPQNFSTKANLLFIWSLVNSRQQTSLRAEMDPFFPERAHSHLKVLCFIIGWTLSIVGTVCFLILCCVCHLGTQKTHLTENLKIWLQKIQISAFFLQVCHLVLPSKTLELTHCLRHFQNVMIMWWFIDPSEEIFLLLAPLAGGLEW